MAYFNYFIAKAACPSCHRTQDFSFQADIGVLRWDSYFLGDTIAHKSLPGERFPLGPDPSCDWTRPFWAAGLDRCKECDTDVKARIEVHHSRFEAAIPDNNITDDFAWGYLDIPSHVD